jgi:hypothetical protein
VRAMNFLIDQGLAFYWGTSEWTAQMIEEARGVARAAGPTMAPPIFEQVSYSMLMRDRVEMEHKRLYPQLGLTAFAPLQGGVLTGKYSSDPTSWPEEWRRAKGGAPEESIATAEALKPIAVELGCSVAQLAMAWCLTNPNVSTCLMGASRLEQARRPPPRRLNTTGSRLNTASTVNTLRGSLSCMLLNLVSWVCISLRQIFSNSLDDSYVAYDRCSGAQTTRT